MYRCNPLGPTMALGIITALTTGLAIAAGTDADIKAPPSPSPSPTKVPTPALEHIGDNAKPLLPFDLLDRNHDGVLSTNEANQSPDLVSRWEVLDTNGDGLLDRSEMAFIYDTLPPTAAEAPR